MSLQYLFCFKIRYSTSVRDQYDIYLTILLYCVREVVGLGTPHLERNRVFATTVRVLLFSGRTGRELLTLFAHKIVGKLHQIDSIVISYTTYD